LRVLSQSLPFLLLYLVARKLSDPQILIHFGTRTRNSGSANQLW